MDDILVYGRNKDEHDVRLRRVLEVANQNNLKFNIEKCGIAKEEINYLGHVLSKQGIKPGHTKVEAVTKMPTPQNKGDVMRFLGMANYLSKHIPNLYYDVNESVVILTDSSKSGIGSALLQKGKPVPYASRAMSQSEMSSAQIEKELLAVVYACERFNQFVYGKHVKVESDHKPQS